jgi:hypothetical protein
MKKIKLPNPITLIFGSIGAFWLANIINPGFNPIGIMILLLIPVLIIDLLYPQPELKQLLEKMHSDSNELAAQKVSASDELMDDATETAL